MKKFFRKCQSHMIGFRSNQPAKKMIAIMYYVLNLVMLTYIQRHHFAYLVFCSMIPIIFFALIDACRGKAEQLKKIPICFLILFLSVWVSELF